MKKLLLLFLFFSTQILCAQTPAKEDVVYLKNGSIYRGRVLETIPDKTVKIEIIGRNILVFQMNEVEKITSEDSPKGKVSENSDDQPKSDFEVKKKGFENVSEIGGFFYENGVNFAIRTVNGYRFNRALFLGLGTGIDLGGFSEPYIPIYLEFSARFSPKKTSALAYTDLGIVYPISTDRYSDNRPGFGIAEFGGGVATYISRKIQFHFRAGFSLLMFTGDNYGGGLVSSVSPAGTLRVGFTF